MRNDDIRDEPIDGGNAPRNSWTMTGIAILSMVVLIAGGLMIYNYFGTRTTTATNPSAQTGFAPIVDEVRPVPSTTGQGGGERR